MKGRVASPHAFTLHRAPTLKCLVDDDVNTVMLVLTAFAARSACHVHSRGMPRQMQRGVNASNYSAVIEQDMFIAVDEGCCCRAAGFTGTNTTFSPMTSIYFRAKEEDPFLSGLKGKKRQPPMPYRMQRIYASPVTLLPRQLPRVAIR